MRRSSSSTSSGCAIWRGEGLFITILPCIFEHTSHSLFTFRFLFILLCLTCLTKERISWDLKMQNFYKKIKKKSLSKIGGEIGLPRGIFCLYLPQKPQKIHGIFFEILKDSVLFTLFSAYPSLVICYAFIFCFSLLFNLFQVLIPFHFYSLSLHYKIQYLVP